MTAHVVNSRVLSLKAAFEAEFARRDAERHAREEAQRRQQEEDLAQAQALHAAISADPDFLAQRALAAELRRYTVSLDHQDYRIAAYFEDGRANVTAADKRDANPGLVTPRRQETAETVEDALRIMAQFLADETL